MPYRFESLDPAVFAPLAALDDVALAARHIVVSTVQPGDRAPCRLTLENTPAGETVLLVNHTHQPTLSPYGARGPIYIRKAALGGQPVITATLPAMLVGRQMSVRAYDTAGMIVDGAVVEAADLTPHLDALFRRADVDEVHLHFPGRGCYAAKATRAPEDQAEASLTSASL